MPSKSKSPKRGLKKSLSKSSLASSLSTYSGEDDELRPNKERTRKPDSRAQRWETQRERASPPVAMLPRLLSRRWAGSALAGSATAGVALTPTLFMPEAERSSSCHHPGLCAVITAEHVRALESQAFVVIEGAVQQVLGAATLEDARQRAAESLAAGHFLASRNRGQKVRDDVVLWISSADETTTGLAQCAELLRGVASAVEQHGYRGSRSHGVPLLLQLSCFRGGSAALGYARHVDCNFQSMAELGVLGWLRASGSRSRVLTAMVYLNDPHWTGAEGGELRVYHGMQWFDVEDNAGQWRDYTDILPRGGTLVIFDSRLVQHQVLPPRGRNRFALTCWILGRSDGTRRAF
eukprot:s239_g19.t2